MADRWPDPQTSLSATGLAGGGATVVGSALSFHNAARAKFIVIWPANITAGVVTIEESDDASYSGTWRQFYTFNFSAGSKAGQEFDGPLFFLRARLVGSTGTQTDPVVVKCQAMESYI